MLRFYLWLKYHKLSLKIIRRSHILDYIEFAKNPDERWFGKRRRFEHPDWKPFRKPLTSQAIIHNLQIIRQLFSYLFNIAYLDFNPCKLRFKIPSPTYNPSAFDHCLTRQEINLIGNFISKFPENTNSRYFYKVRCRWIFQVLLFTGCRKSEVSNATMDDFILIRNKLWLQVNGKGNKYGKIPVSIPLELRLNEYRAAYGLPRIRERINTESHIPLVIQSKYSEYKYKSVTHGYIWHIVKLTCRNIASTLNDTLLYSRLCRVSPHWLRHTSATIQIDSGIDIRDVQANLRHSSIKTTILYLHVDNDYRHSETVTKFSQYLLS